MSQFTLDDLATELRLLESQLDSIHQENKIIMEQQTYLNDTLNKMGPLLDQLDQKMSDVAAHSPPTSACIVFNIPDLARLIATDSDLKTVGQLALINKTVCQSIQSKLMLLNNFGQISKLTKGSMCSPWSLNLPPRHLPEMLDYVRTWRGIHDDHVWIFEKIYKQNCEMIYFGKGTTTIPFWNAYNISRRNCNRIINWILDNDAIKIFKFKIRTNNRPFRKSIYKWYLISYHTFDFLRAYMGAAHYDHATAIRLLDFCKNPQPQTYEMIFQAAAKYTRTEFVRELLIRTIDGRITLYTKYIGDHILHIEDRHLIDLAYIINGGLHFSICPKYIRKKTIRKNFIEYIYQFKPNDMIECLKHNFKCIPAFRRNNHELFECVIDAPMCTCDLYMWLSDGEFAYSIANLIPIVCRKTHTPCKYCPTDAEKHFSRIIYVCPKYVTYYINYLQCNNLLNDNYFCQYDNIAKYHKVNGRDALAVLIEYLRTHQIEINEEICKQFI